MLVLRLGNRGLYCVIKLHEVEKVVLSNLGFLTSPLVSFSISENCFFFFFLVLPGLQSLAIK